jgi:nucleotide-binding universal stress UspA family protein
MIEYPEYKKVLFCTDFSENADYAFTFAYGIAKRDEGLLYILHVIPPYPHQIYPYIPREDLERIEKNIEKDLDDAYTERYVKHITDGVRFEIITKSGREDEQILKFARDNKVDIVVMGTHGRTGIEHVFFGSVAEKVIRHCPFPVFIIPCKKKQR